MTLPQQIASQVRAFYFGPSYVGASMKEHLDEINYQLAHNQIDSLNTIAKLVYHIHYYVRVVTRVLQGGPLDGSDKYSYDIPPINSEEEWQDFQKLVFSEAELFIQLVNDFEEDKLTEIMADERYGNWFRNITGIIEHGYYHLGQIVIIKKMLENEN